MEKPQQKESITIDDIDRIDPRRAALAWENFHKNLNNGISNIEARKILMEDLLRFLNSKSKPNPNIVLLGEPKESVRKLKKYLTDSAPKSDVDNKEKIRRQIENFENDYKKERDTDVEGFERTKRAYEKYLILSYEFLDYGNQLVDMRMLSEVTEVTETFTQIIQELNQRIFESNNFRQMETAYVIANEKIKSLIKNSEA